METITLKDAGAVARQAAQMILQAAAAAIAKKGSFHLVLAGGGTPLRCYRLLSQADADWSHWHIYFGDERCLPVDDPERNSRMAAQVLGERVAIPPDQWHPIRTELGAIAAAECYETLISHALPFDLVLLGMGEDGHTASLFPGHTHPNDRLVVAVHDAPKPPPERVSLTARALADCQQLLILVTGEGKKEALKRWQDGADLPITRIAPRDLVTLLTDLTL